MMANLVIKSEQKAAIATKIAKVNEEVLPHVNQNYQYVLNFIEIVMCVIIYCSFVKVLHYSVE